MSKSIASPSPQLHQVLLETCREFSRENPRWALPEEAARILADRVQARLHFHDCRREVDRQLLDWIDANREEAAQLLALPGDLRRILALEMEASRLLSA